MDYIEKLDLQTEEIKEVENLEKHTIINNEPFTADEYVGHDRDFLAIDGEHDDGFNQLNKTNGLGISCNVSKEVREAREDINGVYHTKLKDRIDSEVNNIKTSLDNIALQLVLTPSQQTDYSFMFKNKSYNTKKWIGNDNSTLITKALEGGNKTIMFPKGHYNGGTININDSNITIIGNGKNSTFLHGVSFIINDNVKNITIKDITFDSVVTVLDIPLPIKLGEPDSNDFNNFYFDDVYKWGFDGDAVHFRESTKDYAIENVIVDNCEFIGRTNGLACMSANTNSKLVKNIKVTNCSSYNLFWHGVGFRKIENGMVENCTFKNHWVGMMVDFSEGSSGSMSKCIGENMCVFFKTDYSKDTTKNITINNNICKTWGDNTNSYKQYGLQCNGSNIDIYNNVLHFEYNIPNYSLINILKGNPDINNNKFLIKGNIYSILAIKGDSDLTFANNDIKFENNLQNTRTAISVIGGFNNVNILNNNFNGVFTYFILNELSNTNIYNSLVINGNKFNAYSPIYSSQIYFEVNDVKLLNNEIGFGKHQHSVFTGKIKFLNFDIYNNRFSLIDKSVLANFYEVFLIGSDVQFNECVIKGNFINGLTHICNLNNQDTNRTLYMIDNCVILKGLSNYKKTLSYSSDTTLIMKNVIINGKELYDYDTHEFNKNIDINSNSVKDEVTLIGNFTVNTI